jgi:hypothetical protein
MVTVLPDRYLCGFDDQLNLSLLTSAFDFVGDLGMARTCSSRF